jgi:hypothetical protein
VTKTGLFLTSFVAAIPGAGLAVLMVMSFLEHSGGPTMWVKALAGMLLIIGSLLAVMPFGILVFAGPKSDKAPKKADTADKEAGSAVVEAEVEEAGDKSGSRAAVTDASLEVVDSASEEFAASDEEGAAAAEDDSDFEVNTPEDGSEADFFETDDAPKKGKKK